MTNRIRVAGSSDRLPRSTSIKPTRLPSRSAFSWSADATKERSAHLQGDSVITVLNDCTHWDHLFKAKNIRCEESCTRHEIPSMVKAAGNCVVTMPESRPCGDSRCVFKITKVA